VTSARLLPCGALLTLCDRRYVVMSVLAPSISEKPSGTLQDISLERQRKLN
jgi:hypothetical protein